MQLMWQGVSMSNPIYDYIDTEVRKTYPNCCILYIEEVKNPYLTEKYDMMKEQLILKRGSDSIKELRLFHGTKNANINSIGLNGFLVNSNVRSVYGVGTYFSTHAGYSKDYTDEDDDIVSYMFLCNVLVGKCTIVSSSQQINTDLYDTAVNQLHNPTIYVTPYDDACVPRYLVAFHKNAL